MKQTIISEITFLFRSLAVLALWLIIAAAAFCIFLSFNPDTLKVDMPELFYGGASVACFCGFLLASLPSSNTSKK